MSDEFPMGWSTREAESLYDRLKVQVVYDKNTVKNYGKYEVIDQSQSESIGYVDDGIFNCDSKSPIVTFANHTCAVRKMTRAFGVIQNVFPLQAKDDIDPHFLYQLLRDAVPQTGYKGHYPELREKQFIVPTKTEQQKIAEILTSVDEVIENTQSQITKLEDLKRATMNELLTKGIGHTEFKETEIGRIPKTWSIHPFSVLCEVVNGQVDPTVEPYASMPHIGPGNIEQDTGVLLAYRSAKEDAQISGKYLFGERHVLYGKINPQLSKVTFPKICGVCSADVYPILPRENKLTSDFLYLLLLSERFKRYAMSVSGRTGMPKINREDLDIALFPVPQKSEQMKISEVVGTLSKTLSEKKNKLTHNKFLKASLMQDLLTGKVRVTVN